MSKKKSSNIVMTGRSANAFIASSKRANAAVQKKTSNYFSYLSSTTSVSRQGNVLIIKSTGEKYSPK